MKEEHEFLVPDYYEQFSCKMGDCRAACCVGWPITISMQNYFHLVGVSCPRRLRQRLDCGVYVVDHPTAEEYARFEPRYDGNCPLRLEDGRCALHAELGEEHLPDICRLYPRGLRAGEAGCECSCANSCEAVLELLADREPPLRFQRRVLPLPIPAPMRRQTEFQTLGQGQQIRLYLIEAMQDRRLPLPGRLLRLRDLMASIQAFMQVGDGEELSRFLHTPLPLLPERQREVTVPQLQQGLQMAERMVSMLDDRSQSIRGCGEAALAYFGEGEQALERYQTARAHFEECVPAWETFYEHMLVNHMFFSQFPFQDRPESLADEHLALCAVYTVLRFLGLGCMAESRDRASLIDGMAATFRLIEHTEYDRYISRLLHSLSDDTDGQLYELLCL